MMGEMSGPMFWHLDGSEMDDEFAFDFSHRTREEWEENQRGWEELGRRLDAERAERERLGVIGPMSREDGDDGIWSRSFSVGDSIDVPLGVRLFGVGGRLAELIVGLRGGADRDATAPEAQRLIDELNRDFGNFREILQSPDRSLAEALIDPVLRRFVESLDSVATSHPDLALQCESVADLLKTLLEPDSPESLEEYP
jgi:hypothetical protein